MRISDWSSDVCSSDLLRSQFRILSNASATIAEGEVNQLTAQRQVEISEERYLDIISAKTAALFAAATRIEAVVAERAEAVETALESYGRYLGIAFQLVYDALVRTRVSGGKRVSGSLVL